MCRLIRKVKNLVSHQLPFSLKFKGEDMLHKLADLLRESGFSEKEGNTANKLRFERGRQEAVIMFAFGNTDVQMKMK